MKNARWYIGDKNDPVIAEGETSDYPNTTFRTMGSAYFTEPFDFSNSSVSTLLVPIWPHQDIQEARGVWGIITGGDDSTEIFGAIARIDLSVFVLAEYSDYSTESDVRTEFESTI